MISVYNLTIDSIEGKFHLETEVTKVDRGELLTFNNSRYKETIAKFPHLKEVKMVDVDEKPHLPVHLIPQETHTLCVFDRLPVVSWRRAKYKQMYGLKSTLTVSR